MNRAVNTTTATAGDNFRRLHFLQLLKQQLQAPKYDINSNIGMQPAPLAHKSMQRGLHHPHLHKSDYSQAGSTYI
jgi:hypothetical protein